MKKTTIGIIALLSANLLFSQQQPTGNNPTHGPSINSQYYWSRAGNGVVNGSNNLLGTRWNSPIYFITGGGTAGGALRMKLNGNFGPGTGSNQYSISTYGTFGNGPNQVNTSGYLGLGSGLTGSYKLWEDNTSGPFTLLHLNGRNGTFVQDAGYRPWMKTGITFTDNQDFMYFGTRGVPSSNPGGYDLTEQIAAWGDNPGSTNTDGDDFVFRFVGKGSGTTVPISNRNNNADIDGRHIARFTSHGNFGIGATFGFASEGYTIPQSIIHASRYRKGDTWIQVTNQSGTGETATDGLRMGITNNGTAHIKQQEELPLIFYTENIEDARIIPNSASTLPGNHGMMGIGDWTTAFNIANPIDAKLDIDGDLRVRTVTQDESLNQILVIDPTDNNRVHWRDANLLTGGNVTADNGCSINPANNVQLGNDVGLTTAQLLNDREIPMNNQDIQFTGIGSQGNNLVSFGQPAATTPYPVTSKVHMYNDHEQIAVGGYTDATNITAHIPVYAVDGYLTRAETDQGAAVHGLMENSLSGLPGTGVHGEAANNQINFGVRGSSFDNNSQINYGGNFSAFGGQTNNYGIYASSGSNPTDFAGFFQGDVYVNGPTSGNGYLTVSDRKFKTDITTIENALDIIGQLRSTTYNFNHEKFEPINFSDKKQYGFIAQEVEEVLPDLVVEQVFPAQYNSKGELVSEAIEYKAVNYDGFISVLAAGIKEQQGIINEMNAKLKEQDAKIEELFNKVNSCCSTGNSKVDNDDSASGTTIDLELEDVASIVLEQNVPNPFAEKTTINYHLPEDVVKAQILFYNASGKLINSVELAERGNGQINVFAADLSNGVYTYTLVADGKIIDSKRMIKK